ncbi:hypothetical protein RhiirB3_446072 [Rhizophagus irregularis]|nr:hypothetical protein RhiirB3_446072 [Rhizophagus irregularis]
MIASCVNEIFLTMDTTSAHDSNSDDFNTNESNSDANKSDSDVYFKSNDSDSDDEEKNTKPADDDFDKILMEIHKNHDIYFDNSIPQLVMNPIISPVTA